jgi:fructose-1,6-bisphosphatase/inositol monophosphatase family enzyme
MLAAGKVDVWFNPKVAPWDIAALRIIIKEAGGLFLVLGRSGTTTESVIACTPGLLQVVAKEFGFAP